jgi:anti-sigma factor RsiW
MPTHCHDIETLLPTYLDGEMASNDHLSFEHHMADCEACRDRVLAEGAYRARVRELLTPPPAPAHLAARVREALDHHEQQARTARRRFGRSWALPGMSVLAAAAALVLFVTSHASRDGDGETRGQLAATSGADRLLHLPLSPSGLGSPGGGALTSWLPRRVEFDVQRSDAQKHSVLLQVLGCRGIDLRGDEHVPVTGSDVYVGRRGRLNTVTLDRGNGVCLVFTSDMEADQLLSGVLRLGMSRP